MIDYTSSLYLDMRHESRELQPWKQLTTGSPAALASVAGTGKVEADLAGVMGTEGAVLCRSTLHAFLDVLETLADGGLRIYCDAGAYPIASWAIERRQALGDVVQKFPEHNACELFRLLQRDRIANGVPVVVADALSIRTGSIAPLHAYARAARRFGGWLVIDDTQAFGLLGEPGAAGYGHGGGGSLRWHGLRARNVVVIASLAKAFGVPATVLAGASPVVQRFRRMAPNRYHSSAPSAADIAAVFNALRINGCEGDGRRGRLFRRIRFFRAGLRLAGIEAEGGMFPLQTLPAMLVRAARGLQVVLARRGIRTLLVGAAGTAQTAAVAFLITVRHSFSELKLTLDAVQNAVSGYEVKEHWHAG